MILEILSYIAIYLFTGYTLAIIVSLVSPVHFSIDEKVVMIIFWPYIAYKMLEGYILGIKDRFNEKDD